VDIQEIKETAIWTLFEKGRNYHRLTNVYSDTDRNYRFYNGNQWEGVKLGDSVEPVQKNFIKPIVKYKVSVIHDNLYAINYSSQNFTNQEFAKVSDKYCDMLNRYAHRVWEQDKMDFKGRRITKDSAINDEGIIYIDFDQEKMIPVNEIVKKNDIFYGNENDDDIQSQPYILIRKRMPVSNAIEFALANGLSEDKKEFIIGDNDTFEESGDAAKQEVDDMVTIVYKMYKKDGTVHFSVATRWVDIIEDTDIGISLYPIAHFNWEEKAGSARGEGETRYLIPNQIEVNKTEMRRVLAVKHQAYPKTVVDKSKISNPQALNTVGATIITNGQPVEDVHKIIGTIQPAQMSSDVKLLQDDLIQMSRDLAGAGDTATGEIDPESASGRAILAVQNASRQPMTEQKEAYKNFVEDVARIWLEYLIAYSTDGIDLEDEITDEMGETSVQVVRVPQTVLKELQATVKIDITPKSVYDKFAQEQTLENMLVQGLFNIQRLPELEAYVNALDDDSVAPKQKLLEIIERMKNEQRKIARIEAQTQLMQQQANRFIMDDPDGQAQQIADAQKEMSAMEQIKQALAQARAKGELDEDTEEEEMPDEE
jgi:hypothetical protein